MIPRILAEARNDFDVCRILKGNAPHPERTSFGGEKKQVAGGLFPI